MCHEKLKKYVEAALKNEDLLNYNIEVHGTTSKHDGYLGNILFLTVTGKTKNEVKKKLDFVIKYPTESNTLREQVPISEFFKKEIYIYDQVKSTFEKFQEDKGTKNLLNFFPYCYASSTTEGEEFLVLENLKPRGFDMWDRQIPLTYDHIKLVLEAYGKFHAFSFALKRENSEIFEKLTENNIDMFRYFLDKSKGVPAIQKWFQEAKNEITRTDDIEFIDKLQFSQKDIFYIFGDMLKEDPAHQVITHLDGWNNNFLFKYQDVSKYPLSVRILDWQCSGVSSPVIDLSFFIYTCCNTGELNEVTELLTIYHESLDECLRQLGFKSDEIFSYDDLLKHWKKFSCYGFLRAIYILRFSFSEGDETPDFAETAEQGKDFSENFNFTIERKKSMYNKRIKDNFRHYIHNLN